MNQEHLKVGKDGDDSRKMIRSLLLAQKQSLEHMLHSVSLLNDQMGDQKTDLETFSVLYDASNIHIRGGARIIQSICDSLDGLLTGKQGGNK